MKEFKACRLDELAEGKGKVFEVNETDILIFLINGNPYATQPLCPHTFAPLKFGTIEKNCIVRCNLHRARFSLEDGSVKNWANFPPGIQLLNKLRGEKDLITYKSSVNENSEVLVEC